MLHDCDRTQVEMWLTRAAAIATVNEAVGLRTWRRSPHAAASGGGAKLTPTIIENCQTTVQTRRTLPWCERTSRNFLGRSVSLSRII